MALLMSSSVSAPRSFSLAEAVEQGFFTEPSTLHLLSFGVDGFPPYATSAEQRFRWAAGWELSAGVARGHGADPGQVNMFTAHALRSLFGDESLPTFGSGKSVE